MTKSVDAGAVREWPDGAGVASVPLVLCAAAGAVIGVAIDAVVEFGVNKPHTGRLHLIPAVLVTAALVMFTVSLTAAGGKRSRSGAAEPAGFVVRPGSFIAPPTWAFGASLAAQALSCGFVASLSIEHWSHARYSPFGQTEVDVALWGLVSFLCCLFAVVIAVELVGLGQVRPGVQLTPTALMVSGPAGSMTVPWVALRPGAVPVVGSRRVLTIVAERPDLIQRQGLMFGSGVSGHRAGQQHINVKLVRVNPFFLAAAIHRYTAEPARRADIGLPAEHQALLAHR